MSEEPEKAGNTEAEESRLRGGSEIRRSCAFKDGGERKKKPAGRKRGAVQSAIGTAVERGIDRDVSEEPGKAENTEAEESRPRRAGDQTFIRI